MATTTQSKPTRRASSAPAADTGAAAPAKKARAAKAKSAVAEPLNAAAPAAKKTAAEKAPAKKATAKPAAAQTAATQTATADQAAAQAAPAKTKAVKPVTAAAPVAAAPAAKKSAAKKSATRAPVTALEAAAPLANVPARPATGKRAAPAAAAAVTPAAPAPAPKTPARQAAAKPALVPAVAPAAVPVSAPAAVPAAATKKVAAKKVAAKKTAAKKTAAKNATAKTSAVQPAAAPQAQPVAEPLPVAAPTETAAPVATPIADVTAAAPAAAVGTGRRRSAAARAAGPAETPGTDTTAPAVATTVAADPVAAEPARAEAVPAEAAAPPDAAPTTEVRADRPAHEGRRERGPRPERGGRGQRGEQSDRGGRTERAAPPAPAAREARADAAPPSDRPGRRRHDTSPDASPDTSPEPTHDSAPDTALDMAAAAPAPASAPVRAQAPVGPASGPAHSRIALSGGDLQQLLWQPGHRCPAALAEAAHDRLDADGHLRPEDDDALPLLLRLAHEGGHTLTVDAAVWPLLAAHRDARTRLDRLALAYPDGPASAGLQHLLRAPLPLFQAEGALFAVIAGRALLADERGLGKSVQAIAATQLWQRHFGLQRVLLLCAPAQAVAWQRAFARFAGQAAQLVSGGHHQRQALWSGAAEVRILTPDALDSDAAHVAVWAPELVIVDEPQQLGPNWATLDAPHALVLCGAPLDAQPALLAQLVDWLDPYRQGALAAVHRIQAAQADGTALDDAAIELITEQLSRVLLQRGREDVADQLPPLVHSERLLALAPPQRAAHDSALALVRRLVAGWQRTGYLSDADQLRLGQALRDAQDACHRADPARPDSLLADATVQAAVAQLADWAGTGATQLALVCAHEAQRQQLAQRLHDVDGLSLLLHGEATPAGCDAVLQVGVPWRPRRSPAGRRGDAPRGQQWLYLLGQDSLEAGLFDTLAQRADVPRSLADGGRGLLQAEPLTAWLQAIAAALQAITPVAQPGASAG